MKALECRTGAHRSGVGQGKASGVQIMMAYYLSRLPALGELGSRPPVTPAELLSSVESSPRLHDALACLFLADDLTRREAVLAGEDLDTSSVVLSPAEMRSATLLPEFLAHEWSPDSGMPRSDALWMAYFHYVMAEAERLDSVFLREWAAFEFGLREALADVRRRRLGLDAPRNPAELDADQSPADYAAILAAWEAAEDGLAGWRVLMRARWAWLNEHDGWFSFAFDEVLAYAAKLSLLIRWRRVSDRAEQLIASPRPAERSRP